MAGSRDRYDYVVVGAGASGCALAGRLAEMPGVRVALVEAGGPNDNPLLKIPATSFLVNTSPKYNWNFKTDPIPGLSGRGLTLLQGRVLGGSSSINGMIFTRGHRRNYDIWQQMGCIGWGADDVMPFFLRSENNARGAGPLHGDKGPVGVRPAKPPLPICEAFLAAVEQAGIPRVPDLNDDIVDGFGYYDVNVDRGRRSSSADAYLRSPAALANIDIILNTQVTRVVIENGRARGVEVASGTTVTQIAAEREVILCGGAVMSPHILMHSGVGPAAHLREMGIPIRVDSQGVGQNLQNHPCYRVQYTCNGPVSLRAHLNPLRGLKALAEYGLFRRGVLAESAVSAGGFFRTQPHLELPDAQVAMIAALVPRLSGEERVLDLLPKQEGFSMTIYQGTPRSRGEILLRSSNPLDRPRILPNYFADPHDLDTLVRAVHRMREAMTMPAIAPLLKEELRPGPSIATDAELREEIRQNGATSYHQCGTCAMGAQDTAVVDLALRVRGVEGLRVADAAIIPLLPNAALHAPTIMIGERAADLIRSAA